MKIGDKVKIKSTFKGLGGSVLSPEIIKAYAGKEGIIMEILPSSNVVKLYKVKFKAIQSGSYQTRTFYKTDFESCFNTQFDNNQKTKIDEALNKLKSIGL